ncbi:hypothetical protein O181_025720 [Austropuccinia psidii MF-1]|uniref:Uncharacterized protein n=1 Tax=Austropuccinia psidii MF-1 TaxID=1389203 RepID=A0A9Q3CN11_9BASI|nr:hypothetical protein [Austropuccinia psidii MF-1]
MSPVHLRNLGIPRNQPEDMQRLFSTRRPGSGHHGHHNRWQVSQPCKKNPLNWCLWQCKPPPIYGQFGHILNLIPFEPSWRGMEFWPFMAPKPYPASLASLANPQSHQPPGQYLNSGPGGRLAFQGPLAPLTLSRDFGPPPLIRGVGGLNGRVGPFRPSTAHGPYAVEPIRPLLAQFQ